MKVSELSPIVIALYNAGRTGMVWGPPGVGKSDGFKTAAKAIAAALGLAGPVLERHEIQEFSRNGGNMRQAFGLFDLRLSQMDPVEIGGLPRENKNNGTMEKLPPSWFAHGGRADLPDYGILLLEELPSAPLSIQTTAYQIALDGIIGDYRLKDGWGTFAAGNRLSDGGQYFKMPNALANRMCHITVESDLQGWVDWAIDRGIDHSLVAFVRFRPELLNTYEEHVSKRGKDFAFATERQWEAVDDFLKGNSQAGQLQVNQAEAHAIVSGLVGGGPAAEYMGFRDVWHKMPDIDGITIDPDSSVLPEDAATLYAVMTALGAKANSTNVGNCFKYIDRVTQMGRAEMSVLFVRDMQRRQNLEQQAAIREGRTFVSAVKTPAYSAWASKNAALFA